MVKHLLLGLLLTLSAPASAEDTAKTNALLDSLHSAASKANWADYFQHFGKDAIFIGTDASEVWTIPAFKAYAQKTKGWTYSLQSRQVIFNDTKTVAWFHELLSNKSYGTARGTGTLLKTPDGWKIAQYSLTIPVPNEIAIDIVKQIQKAEKDK